MSLVVTAVYAAELLKWHVAIFMLHFFYGPTVSEMSTMQFMLLQIKLQWSVVHCA